MQRSMSLVVFSLFEHVVQRVKPVRPKHMVNVRSNTPYNTVVIEFAYGNPLFSCVKPIWICGPRSKLD